MLQKLRPGNRPKSIELTSFEASLVRNATAVDAADILPTISNALVADYLPAEREDRPAPSRRAPRRTSADDDDDDVDVDMEEDEVESANSLDEADGPGSSDDEEIDEDDGYIYLDEPTPPEGFENYEMPETAHFLTPSEITKGGWYLLLCTISDGGWWLGKIKSYSPRTKTWNFTIQWGCSEAPERQSAKLEHYFRPASGESTVSGNWVYLKQPGRSSARRERDNNAGSALRAGDKDEDDNFEDDGDTDDDLGDRDSGETPRSRARIFESDGASSGGGGGAQWPLTFFCETNKSASVPSALGRSCPTRKTGTRTGPASMLARSPKSAAVASAAAATAPG